MFIVYKVKFKIVKLQKKDYNEKKNDLEVERT